MGTAYRILPHYTYEDYCRWEGQWEIIEGIPFAMSPAPGMRHQDISGNLYSVFKSALQKDACNCKVFMPLDYKIAEDTVLQPDLLILCNYKMEKYVTETPALVVEVLSPSTALKDRNNKFILYQAQKIPYYLIVDPANNNVEVYHLNTEEKYTLHTHQKAYSFTLDQTCSVTVDFSSIW